MEKETLGSESGRHGDEVLSFKQAGIPQYRSPAQARRPLNSQGRPRPNPYGYPTLPEYPSLHPQHHHRFDSVSMEFNSKFLVENWPFLYLNPDGDLEGVW